jgi:hypothetical protein
VALSFVEKNVFKDFPYECGILRPNVC